MQVITVNNDVGEDDISFTRPHSVKQLVCLNIF